jgi:hypothetical protein
MKRSSQKAPKRGFREILYLLGAFFFQEKKDEMSELQGG